MNKTTRYLGCATVLLLSVFLTYSSYGDDIERDDKAEELSLIEARPLETLPLVLVLDEIELVESVDPVVFELDEELSCYNKTKEKARGIAMFSLVVTTAAELPVDARIALSSINIGAHYGTCKIVKAIRDQAIRDYVIRDQAVRDQ